MLICKYCSKECKNNRSLSAHERMCPKNENKIKKKISNQFIKAKENGLDVPAHILKGKEGRKLTEKQKEHLSKIAKERKFGGYREKAGRTKKYYVKDSYGKEVCLQSTYELRCSEILDTLGIEWLRPKALNYDDKRYFADFYLPEYDLYLDPKNDYKARLDREKIKKVISQNSVRVEILKEVDLTENYIRSLCS